MPTDQSYEFHERIAIIADGCGVSDAELMALRHQFEERQRRLIHERQERLNG
jgi:hypothetical protein